MTLFVIVDVELWLSMPPHTSAAPHWPGIAGGALIALLSISIVPKPWMPPAPPPAALLEPPVIVLFAMIALVRDAPPYTPADVRAAPPWIVFVRISPFAKPTPFVRKKSTPAANCSAVPSLMSFVAISGLLLGAYTATPNDAVPALAAMMSPPTMRLFEIVGEPYTLIAAPPGAAPEPLMPTMRKPSILVVRVIESPASTPSKSVSNTALSYIAGSRVHEHG